MFNTINNRKILTLEELQETGGCVQCGFKPAFSCNTKIKKTNRGFVKKKQAITR